MKASGLAILLAAALLVVPTRVARSAAPRAADGVAVNDARAIEWPPELGQALRGFWGSLKSRGVKRLATTAARTVRTGQRIHVRTFTDERARLYTTGDTYDKAMVSAACSAINLDWNMFGPEKRTPEQWTDDIYDSAGTAFPGDFIWTHFGRTSVAKFVRTSQIAYYSPATARAYWIARG